MNIAGKFPDKFLQVGLSLGLSTEELEVLKTDYPNDVVTKNHMMLMKWKRQNHGTPEHLMKGQLAKAFTTAMRPDLAAKFGGK